MKASTFVGGKIGKGYSLINGIKKIVMMLLFISIFLKSSVQAKEMRANDYMEESVSQTIEATGIKK